MQNYYPKKKEKQEADKLLEIAKSAKITNFFPDDEDPKYPAMYCGSWFATTEGVRSGDPNKLGELACYHPILPIKRLKTINPTIIAAARVKCPSPLILVKMMFQIPRISRAVKKVIPWAKARYRVG